MSEVKVIKEDFDSITELMSTIKSRPNNTVMAGQNNSSATGDKSWYGSSSFDEAEQLLREGYKDILPSVKENMTKIEKDLQSEFTHVPKVRPKNKVVGYVPNVPNAILGLPESMIDSTRIPQKQKTIDVIYIMGGNWGTDAKLFIKAGTILLSAINILEKNRISVRLKVCFMSSENGNELTIPTVVIKDYAQRLDLQKICFPMAHPSMFRRIGFKWLETTPEITEPGFAWGYGRSPIDHADELKTFIQKGKLDQNQRIISAQIIEEMNFDLKTLLSYLKHNENAKSKKD